MELHLSPRVIGKGDKGRTACGSAAYRSGSKIVDNDGVVHNYQYKKERVDGGIELPEGASEELRNPQTLWQRHEQRDIRKDAQLYRDIEFSVPNVLSYAAVRRVALGLAKKLTEQGMCVQWDIHDKYTYKDNDGNVVAPNKRKTGVEYEEVRNLHVHLMLTMRELNPDGSFGKKNRSWNKYGGGLNIADLLRPEAARLMNEELSLIGSSEKVEHESYAARGIDKIPQIHVGVAGTGIDRRGEASYRKQLNDVIQNLNKEHISYLERTQRLRDARAELSANFAAKVGKKKSLFDQINAGEDIQQTSIAEQRLIIDKDYEEIKECNQQIYDLRKEKKQTEKLRKALYTYRNLAGDQNLTREQRNQLLNAAGYIRWATQKEPTIDRVEELIEVVRENNTQRCLNLMAAEKTKRDVLNEIAAAQYTMRALRLEEYRKATQR